MQRASEDVQWIIVKQEFDEMLATKRESALGPDGIPYSNYRCAGGLGSQLLFNAYSSIVEGGSVPLLFAGRTVFIPKSSAVDDNGLSIRSPDVLRSLTSCNCDCGHYFGDVFGPPQLFTEMHSPSPEMHFNQANDRQHLRDRINCCGTQRLYEA